MCVGALDFAFRRLQLARYLRIYESYCAARRTLRARFRVAARIGGSAAQIGGDARRSSLHTRLLGGISDRRSLTSVPFAIAISRIVRRPLRFRICAELSMRMCCRHFATVYDTPPNSSSLALPVYTPRVVSITSPDLREACGMGARHDSCRPCSAQSSWEACYIRKDGISPLIRETLDNFHLEPSTPMHHTLARAAVVVIMSACDDIGARRASAAGNECWAHSEPHTLLPSVDNASTLTKFQNVAVSCINHCSNRPPRNARRGTQAVPIQTYKHRQQPPRPSIPVVRCAPALPMHAVLRSRTAVAAGSRRHCRKLAHDNTRRSLAGRIIHAGRVD
eukprot:IDg16196t1